MINTTVPDGNCLFRSLSKALLGTEKYHYLIRTRLLGFVYANSSIFIPHIQQRCQSQMEVRQYCLAMDASGVWGTELEILAAATMLQAPVYTYTQINSNSYRWLRYLPLSPAHVCTLLLASTMTPCKGLFTWLSQQTTTLNCSTLIVLTTMSLLQIMKTVGLAFHLCPTFNVDVMFCCMLISNLIYTSHLQYWTYTYNKMMKLPGRVNTICETRIGYALWAIAKWLFRPPYKWIHSSWVGGFKCLARFWS